MNRLFILDIYLSLGTFDRNRSLYLYMLVLPFFEYSIFSCFEIRKTIMHGVWYSKISVVVYSRFEYLENSNNLDSTSVCYLEMLLRFVHVTSTNAIRPYKEMELWFKSLMTVFLINFDGKKLKNCVK